MTKTTVSNLAKASLSGDEAAAILPLSAAACQKGKATIEQGKAQGTAALAVMVAGFASDAAAHRAWQFDIKAGDDVHQHVECMGAEQFGETNADWCRNGEGSVSRVAQTAYKAAFQNVFFNLPEPVAAVWTMVSKAVPIARAIREEGMTARVEGGELKLEGGTGERAENMRAAKSLSALAKVAKGETGSNRERGQSGKGEGEDQPRAATPAEVLSAAARLVEGAAKGEEALTGAALSFARRIGELVAKHPEAFAED